MKLKEQVFKIAKLYKKADKDIKIKVGAILSNKKS